MINVSFRNTFFAGLSGLLVVTSALLSLTVFVPRAAAVVDNTPDCDNVAIIKCGAFTQSKLRDICNKNEIGDLDKVYGAFDIACSDMTGMVDGIVWRDGRVTVDGKTVATDAMTAGRNFGGTPISDTKNVGKYSVSKFVDEGQTAFVKMKDGEFVFAVVKACGNPVSAKPKVTVKPTFTCDSLKMTDKISRNEFEFTAKGSAKDGAKVTGYRFTFGDGKTQTISNDVITHKYAEAGNYTVKVETRVSVDNTTKYVSNSNCEIAVTVSPAPAPEKVTVCNPATGEEIEVDKKDESKYKPVGDDACTDVKVCNPATKTVITVKKTKEGDYKPVNDKACQPKVEGEQIVKEEEETPNEIASTGPTDFIAGGLGLSTLTAAGYYLRASRRNLINKILNR